MQQPVSTDRIADLAENKRLSVRGRDHATFRSAPNRACDDRDRGARLSAAITAITRTLQTDDDGGRRGPNAPAALTMRIAKPQDSQHGESAESTVFTEAVCLPGLSERHAGSVVTVFSALSPC